jgi:hypothetical protein
LYLLGGNVYRYFGYYNVDQKHGCYQKKI